MNLSTVPILAAVGLNLTAFFVVCMACHGELARAKPDPAHLTAYYLMLATGGALGGFFVGVVAPYWFNSNYELSIGLVLTALAVAGAVLWKHPFAAPRRRLAAWSGAVVLVLAIGAIRANDHMEKLEGARLTLRNFYGTLRVATGGTGEESYRSLLHGRIIHGRQFTAPDRQDWPTTYYGEQSGAGRALMAKGKAGPLKVGIVGVGIGTLASYGRTGDEYRLYDIDPQVIQVARTEFSYLSRSKASSEVVLGDARLALEREPDQHFHLLLLDAFSGDAVPIHLLTREAFAIYFRHLKPEGVLAIHVSNRFLDLAPVVKLAAEGFGAQARLVESERDDQRQIFSASWVLVSRDGGFFQRPGIREVAKEIPVGAGLRPWRDDYSSVLSVLK